MSYSTDSHLLSILPSASGYVSAGLTVSSEFARHRDWSSRYIDNQLKGRVVVPLVTTGNALLASGLAECEAYYTASRLIRQNFVSNGITNAEYYREYKSIGDDLLKTMYFPASVETPTQLQSFTGNGTITVTVNDQFTYTADWIVKCINTGNPTFNIWNNREGQRGQIVGDYDLSTDTAFPSKSDQDTYSEQGFIREVRIVIATGATAFALGDTWAFRTYGRYRLKTDKRGFVSIPLVFE